MLRALIAEDESKICQLIVKLVDWEALGINLIGTCDNGRTAFEIIERERPEIVITDIRMPQMSGLDLIRAAKEKGIQCEFIIISGYKQFDYAHIALQYGVTEYLLKPISQTELTEALKKAAKRTRIADTTQPTGDRRVWKMRQDLRNSFWERLMEQGSTIKLERNSLNERYQFDFRENSEFRIARVTFYCESSDRFAQTVDDLVEKLRAVGDPVTWEFVPYVKGNLVFFLMNYSSDFDIEKTVQQLYDTVEEGLSKAGEIVPFGVGVSGPEKDVARIKERIHEVRNISFYGMRQGNGKAFLNDKVVYDPVTKEQALPPSQISDLKMAVDGINTQLFTVIVRSALLRCTQKSNPDIALGILETAAKLLSAYADNVGYSFETDAEIEEMIEEASIQPSYRDFVDYSINWITDRFNSFVEQRQSMGSRPVYLAKQYIENHYMEAVTLETVAELGHLNPSYFSIIFKRETGKTFSDYLTIRRIEAAKKLLRETDLGVAEISLEVGYTDNKYFSRKFTKHVGVNPSAYRVLWG